MNGIFDGFEGFNDPTEEEVTGLLQRAMVVVDANVLLDLYSLQEPARELALDVLESLGDRIWVPHQVMREFWRNRHSVLAEVKELNDPIEQVRQELLAIVNGLRPDRERPEEIVDIRDLIEKGLNELSEAIKEARGAALDVRRLMADTSLDPVIRRMESILAGRIGVAFDQTDESQWVAEGLRRFGEKIPPGYADAAGKADQVPERGTGDFLFWEQSLQERESRSGSDPFIIVTGDSKEDWRIVVDKPRKQALGIRPELVAEARKRTGAGVVLLRPTDFYRLMASLRHSDDETTASLVANSRGSTQLSDGHDGANWTEAAYDQLLERLNSAGYGAQVAVVRAAAQNGAFIPRSAVYERTGFDEDRSLRRFTVPVRRIALSLIEDGFLGEDSQIPLEAAYDGPGKAVGFTVPEEFVQFEAIDPPNGPTWLQAAAAAANTDPDRAWTPAALVEKIIAMDLRDVSHAKTPEATLRRDLSQRGWQDFIRLETGEYRLRAARRSLDE